VKINEIKKAVSEGKNVFWRNEGYVVIKDKNNEYLIVATFNGNAIGLTNAKGDILNGQENEFYIK